MSSLNDTQKRGLFSLLTGVDAQPVIIQQADPALPEVVRPTGIETTRDTGSPFGSFFQSGIDKNILGITAGVIVAIALFGIIRKAF